MWDLELSHDCIKMVLWDKTRIAEPLYYHKHKIMQLCMSAKIPRIIENRISISMFVCLCWCVFIHVCKILGVIAGMWQNTSTSKTYRNGKLKPIKNNTLLFREYNS